ncbi:hypothetical protein JUM41_23465 [Rhizobium pusense]|uniref:hypothetical protein n=1 Tax=Agrobacterium pusense TaxID=648995 RepID=UPI001FCCFEB4|nr:hypothetical protein [Agrobacterium pusense]MCJ2877216.1 hypothetical protein [Agrobacterium pusense]
MTLKTLDIAGLFGGPLIWAFNTQLGQILPAVDCGSRTGFTAVAAFLSAGIAVTCGVLSERGRSFTASRMAMFLMSLGVLVALVFAFALLLQGAATLLLNPCAR